MKISYNWLKWYIPDAKSAEEIADVLTYHLTEVEGLEKLPDGDTVIDVNILPNRAADLLSHYGIAKEISGLLGVNFIDPKKTYDDILSKKQVQKTNLEIKVETENLRRYSSRIIRNIKVGPSPEWVVKHLESVGQRSINNIVDATNLVMLNCGQPTHAFDLRNFSDEKIYIKNANPEEKLTLVGREEIVANLKETDLVISNSSGQTMALGGIKGGLSSGVKDDTTSLLIEVGNFDPICIRKTARRIGVLSDAAKRFENNVSPELCDYGMLELTSLICEMCPDAIIEEVVDFYPDNFKNKFKENNNLEINSDFINKKLGSEIKDEDIKNILTNFGFWYEFSNGNFIVSVPTSRPDLKIEEDLVEEIGRSYGYEKVKPVLPSLEFAIKDNKQNNKIQEIRNSLITNGYYEVVNYSFVKKGDIQVARGLKGKDFLRTNLMDGLKESYEINKNNAPLLGLNEIKIFEIGTVFKDGSEEIHVAYINKKEAKEFSLDNFVQPDTVLENKIFGPRVSSPDAKIPVSNFVPTFKPWSQYPFITRDIAVWVDGDTTTELLMDKIRESMGELVVSGPTLFDTFTKDGRNSYAFRLVFQSFERTLTGEEVEDIVSKISQNLKQIKGLELR